MGAISTVDTSGLALKGRLDYWNTVVGDIFSGMVVDSAAERFDGRLLHVRMGRVGFVRANSTSAMVRRWQGSDHARPTEASLIVHLQHAGSCINRQGRREAWLAQGDFTLCDSTQPYSIELSPRNDMLVVDLPLDMVAERLPGFEVHFLKTVSGGSPQLRMLRSFLLTLWQECQTESQDNHWVDGLENVLLDLLGQSLKAQSLNSASTETVRLQQRLIATVHDNLTDPVLNTSSLAVDAGVSVRTVQSVFARMGTTPMVYVLERRLALAADWLRAQPDRHITDIAFAVGFNDSAYFTRRFRQRYGCSPREYRLR